MTIAADITSINSTKLALRAAIEAKGVPVGAVPFASYASKIVAITSGGGDEGTWVRPPDWLDLPSIGASEQKLIALYAVFSGEPNMVALSCGGDYTVDWGDGTVTNYASGIIAERSLSYADLSPATQSSRGYRQAIITVTPQSGQNLVSLYLNKVPSSWSASFVRAQKWLEIKFNAPNLTSLTIGSSTSPGTTTRKAVFSLLESVIMQHAGGITNLDYMFWNLPALQSVALPAVHSFSTMTGTFDSSGLKAIKVPSAPLVTSTASMFSNCKSLITAEIADISAAQNISSMFASCISLKKIIISSLPAVTNSSFMFSACASLVVSPALYLPLATNVASMFSGCTNLKDVGAITLGSATTMASMFANCQSLLSAVPLASNLVTTMSSMYTGCTSLRIAKAIDGLSCTTLSTMFSGCGVLETVEFTRMVALPAVSSLFAGCFSLNSCLAPGLGQTFTILNANMGAGELDALYASLGVASAKTITVTGNYGVTGDNPAIATAKGWTVTG